MSPTIDTGTLYLATAVVAGFFGISFLLFHLIDRETQGVLQWGTAYLLIGCGLTLSLFRDVLPLFFYSPLASFGFVSAAVLLDLGMRDARLGRVTGVNYGLPLVAFGLLLFFSYVVPSLAARLQVLFISVALATCRTSYRLIRDSFGAQQGLRPAYVIFAAFYSVLALVLVSISLLAAIVGPVQNVVGGHPVHAVLLPGLMLFLIGAGMSKLWVHYLRAYSEARRAATTDALTGLRNRRYVMPELERMFQRAQREHLRLACLMLDADAFKSVNDTYGHRKGDEVLQSLAERITAAVRKYDLVGRYGGEEFIVLVSGLDPQSVVTMARRLHESVRSTPVAGIELTVSVGVAFASTGDARADDLVHRADTALYAAKRNGRDQVSVDDVAHGSP